MQAVTALGLSGCHSMNSITLCCVGFPVDFVEKRFVAVHRHQRRPTLLRVEMRLIQHCIEIDGDQARQIFGAFDVTAYPVQVIRRRVTACLFSQHPRIFTAPALRRIHHQRSLAQRHAREAAGHDRDFSPYKMYGRKSIWRPYEFAIQHTSDGGSTPASAGR